MRAVVHLEHDQCQYLILSPAPCQSEDAHQLSEAVDAVPGGDQVADASA